VSGWSLDPWIVGGLLAAGLLYGRGVAVVWRRAGVGALVGRGRVVAFGSGLYLLAVALLSPLDAAAHLVFSWHMVQHLLLMLVVAPLLVVGAPLLPMLWGLPRPWRLGVGRGWRARPALARAWHAATAPAAVAALLAGVLWIWHLPGPYQAAVLHPGFHRLEHATMLGAALLFWWAVLQPVGRRRVDGGSALLLVFATKVQSAALGAILTFVPEPLYPVYADGAAAWGRTDLQDQHLAGLLMGAVSGVVYVATAALLFVGWLAAIERRQRPPGAAPAPSEVRAPPLELGA